MTVVTVSREIGSEGDRVATLIAERLGLAIVDRQRLHRAARASGVSEAALLELELAGEQRLVAQVLRTLRSVPATATETREHLRYRPSPLAGIFAPVLPPASIAIGELVHMLNQVIEKRARQGNVLFIGQGTQVLLRDFPETVHVRVVAPREKRLLSLQASEGLERGEALRRLRASDRERSEYVRRYHNARWDDPTNYHLVINTGLIDPSVAAKVVLAAIEMKAQ